MYFHCVLQVGRKKAPNYTSELRRRVYQVYERYEREKTKHWHYDNLDLIGHIYRKLMVEGYRGIPIHRLFRDEVQDATQAELLLDLRCGFENLHAIHYLFIFRVLCPLSSY